MHSLVGNLIPSLSVLLTMALGGLTAVIGGPRARCPGSG